MSAKYMTVCYNFLDVILKTYFAVRSKKKTRCLRLHYPQVYLKGVK